MDVNRARLVVAQLLAAYEQQGIFGNQAMPEDQLPAGVSPGSEEHLRFLTLTVAIDYRRTAAQLWEAARRTHADPETTYLFDPVVVSRTSLERVAADLLRYRLASPEAEHEKDPWIWHTVATTLAKRFAGQVKQVLERAGWDAVALLQLVSVERGFPYLKGPKIGPLWVRILHDNGLVALSRLGEVPLPVDIHTARATIQLGCVLPGGTTGDWSSLKEAVQSVWREAISGLDMETYVLRLDEPLWLLSRDGCHKTNRWPCQFAERCPVAAFCHPRQQRLRQDEDRWRLAP